MKVVLIAALILALALPITAANLTAVSGYSVSETNLGAGKFVRGLDVLPNGNFVVLEGSNPDAFGNELTKLYQMQPDGTKVGSDLYTFESNIFGSFVKTAPDGKIYFGESSNGTIQRINLDSTGLTSVATVSYNYDFAFNNLGQQYVVSNPSWASSNIHLLNGSDMDMIVDAASTYSGPMAFDAAGNMFYGTSGNAGGQSLIKWSAAQVAGAIGTSTLAPGDGSALATGLNGISGLASYGTDLIFSTNAWVGPYKLMRYSGGAVSEIATGNAWLGTVRVNSATGAITVAMDNKIETLTAAVPEPCSLLVLTLGLSGLTAFRRKR